MHKATGKIGHERRSRCRVARPHQPCRYELGVGINRRPRPNITKAVLPAQRLRQVLFLRVTERPDFVALKPPTGQVAERLVLIRPTRRANVGQQLEDGGLGHACHALGRANRVALDEGGDNAGLASSVQSVHKTTICQYLLHVQHYFLSPAVLSCASISSRCILTPAA